jgi:hypothetical protein
MAVALYTKGDRQQSLTLGEAALKTDGRYGDLEFLKQNLWGDRLLNDTKNFLQAPRIQAALQQRQQPAAQERQEQPPVRIVPQ